MRFDAVVQMPLRENVSKALDQASYYLLTLPRRIQEVKEAAEAVYNTPTQGNRK